MRCDVQAAKNATPDVKILCEARCLYGIAHISFLWGDIIKSLRFSQNGVETLKKYFGDDASKFKWYGRLVSIVGAAHYELRCFNEAIRCHCKAIEVYQTALDFENDNERQKNIKNEEKCLKNARSMLSTQS